MATVNKDVVLVVSLVLSVVSLVLLFGVTWYFQSSLDLLQQQVEYDRELLFKLQEQINVRVYATTYKHPSYKKLQQWLEKGCGEKIKTKRGQLGLYRNAVDHRKFW